ncbi:Ig mu chain C region membrane-bound form [Trichinella spiralis]|uniref:Ig mu chain C region membrane-bound form n=1 Tax=Trichinella spiralis TaxID=6334 RepID=A0ABR3KKU6_TRISP
MNFLNQSNNSNFAGQRIFSFFSLQVIEATLRSRLLSLSSSLLTSFRITVIHDTSKQPVAFLPFPHHALMGRASHSTTMPLFHLFCPEKSVSGRRHFNSACLAGLTLNTTGESRTWQGRKDIEGANRLVESFTIVKFGLKTGINGQILVMQTAVCCQVLTCSSQHKITNAHIRKSFKQKQS